MIRLRKKLKNAKGYSLVELLMSLAVFSVLMLGVSETYVLFQQYWTDAYREISYQSAARTTLENMGRWIRRASDVNITDTVNDTVMTITDISGDIVRYTYDKPDNTLALTVVGQAGGGGGNKVTICHTPPGNPGNPQTISVSFNALPAHMGHGDPIGACDAIGGAGAGPSINFLEGIVLFNIEEINGQPIYQLGGGKMVDVNFRVRDPDLTDGHQGRDFALSGFWRN